MVGLLIKVVKKLEELEIPYMLSGSIALIAYTTPRMTRDIDFVVNLLPIHIEKFTEAFKTGFYLHRPSVEEEVKRKGMFNLIDNETGYKIDFRHF